MTQRDRRILPFDQARAAAAAVPVPIHWMIEETDPDLGVPAGRIACGLSGADAVAAITSGAWSCLLSNVTCSACRRRFFSDRAHKPSKPTTD